MTEHKITIVAEVTEAERIEPQAEYIEIGQWYWVKKEKGDKGPVEWLACVTEIGSNYVKLRSPHDWEERLHIDTEFNQRTRPEPNYKEILSEYVRESRTRVAQLMEEVQEVMRRLGLGERAIEEKGEVQNYALATMSNATDPKKHKKELIKAKETTLPKLFDAIEKENQNLVTWMKAEVIPLKAQAWRAKKVIKEIDGRIFNVELYAGLSEQVIEITAGEPAPPAEKLYVMQRRLYMDEECLLDYQHGGMEFKNLKEFDRWLAKPKNRDRILPYSRCVVSFRIRRNDKLRECIDFSQLLHNSQQAKLDETTFLFIRNGDRLFRMNCSLDFGTFLFPEKLELDFTEPMMAQHSHGDVKFTPKRDYDDRREKMRLAEEAHDKWVAENPIEEWAKKYVDEKNRKIVEANKNVAEGEEPEELEELATDENWSFHYGWVYRQEAPDTIDYGHKDYVDSNYKSFDRSSVFYDECVEAVDKKVQQYNRIALIIQGLFDRSEVFHPHPPIKLWSAAGVAEALTLVRDGDRILFHGPPPSFEDYRRACNEQVTADSVFLGQHTLWMQAEAVKENGRRDRSWRRSRSDHSVRYFEPYGNPGPGFTAKPKKIRRNGTAVFEWTRERQKSDSWTGKRRGDPLPCKIVVPIECLFNVSAYKPGDFLQFFQDPRMRQHYLHWAPLLLTAEEYHAGNKKIDNYTGRFLIKEMAPYEQARAAERLLLGLEEDAEPPEDED